MAAVVLVNIQRSGFPLPDQVEDRFPPSEDKSAGMTKTILDFRLEKKKEKDGFLLCTCLASDFFKQYIR
jgi:hypothetical protein